MKNPRRLVIAALAISISLFGQSDITKWLHDGQLAVPELNFSISTPTPDAKWSYVGELPKSDGKGSVTFIATLSDGSKFGVNVFGNSSKMVSTDGEQFFIG